MPKERSAFMHRSASHVADNTALAVVPKHYIDMNEYKRSSMADL